MTQTTAQRKRQEGGFTLVELIVVIVIVAVLGGIAMPRFFDNRVFSERGFYEELAAALRTGQKIAVATGCPVRIVIDGSGYAASQQTQSGSRCNPADASFATTVVLTDGSTLTGQAPTGVAVGPAVSFVFDALGATNLGANQIVTVGPYSLTVQAASGYVDAP